MKNEQQPIVVNLPEGQDTITILQGEAPKQLDQQAPAKIDIKGVISAPLEGHRPAQGSYPCLP